MASQAALSPDVYLSGYRDSATGAPVTNGETGVLLSSENAAALLDDSIVDPRFLSPLNGSSWIRFEFDTPVALRGFALALNGGEFATRAGTATARPTRTWRTRSCGRPPDPSKLAR